MNAEPATLAEAIQDIRELRRAVDSRQRIGVALGILMERYGLDEAAAFSYLARVSSHANVKLHVVAANLVADTIRDNGRR